MIRLALFIARKELRIEWRSRVLVWQVLPFSVMAMVIAGLAIGPDESTGRRLAPGLMYLIITLVALQVIGRSHAADDARDTAVSVAMLGIDGGANYLGKVFALFAHLVVVTSALVTVDAVVFHLRFEEVLRGIPFIALSLAAIASAGVLYAALTRGSASLLPVLALPALAPVVMAGERTLTAIFHGGVVSRWVVLLAVITAVYGALGVLLYGAVEES
ncbi:MAG: heme exporter protein CcmB [Acidobacteria bacterium]|nr:heme exporter protein CcmB [Acidobacteriota bacterium]